MITPATIARTAQACHHTQKSLATLARHKLRGTYHEDAALHLLDRNMRDACKRLGIRATYDTRRRAARLVLSAWMEQVAIA